MTSSLRMAVLLAGAGALVVLAGCSPVQKPPASAQMANPASVYCVKLGGKLEIVKTAAGEQGMCHLPDGSVIEEWALYRRDHAGKR